MLSEQDDPHLPAAPVDAVLIVNTYHELTRPAATLSLLFRSMKAGGRLVVADRRPRAGPGMSPEAEKASHRLSPDLAEQDTRTTGFQTISRDDNFIDRADDDPWWLFVFRRP